MAHTHGHAEGHKPSGQRTAQTVRAENAIIDPVCGMTVDPHTTPHRHTYQGHPYYFCSNGCRVKFAADLRGKIVNGDTGLFIVPMIHKKLCRILLPHFDRGDPEPHLREVP